MTVTLPGGLAGERPNNSAFRSRAVIATAIAAINPITPTSARRTLVGAFALFLGWPGQQVGAQTPSHALALRPAAGGPAALAVGDTLPLAVDSVTCHADECEDTPQAVRDFAWSVTPTHAATVSDRGVVHATAAGRVRVRAQQAARTAELSLRIYPPVDHLTWEPRPVTAHVGDTLRLTVVARDHQGRAIAHLPAASAIRQGNDASGQVIDWGGPGPVVVWLDRAGAAILVARLASRTDTLRIHVVKAR